MGHMTDEYEQTVREEARRQALQDEIDRLRPDAERYRRLREMNDDKFAVFACSCGSPRSDGVLLGDHLDTAIDAAMAAEGRE